jgi:uncharacterized membrane protein (UPF0127 family)
MHIKINNNPYIVFSVAVSDEEKAEGLLPYNFLPNGYCMLFDYLKDTSKDKNFTMKGMKFPIDMIGLDENFIVQQIYAQCQPNEQKLFLFGQECKYVLECKSGTVSRNRVSLGDKLEFIGDE